MFGIVGNMHTYTYLSLQCSPWSSPRILSPVDIEHFIASRSSDNLSLLPLDTGLTGSPVRKRWSRRSLARKSLSPEVGMSGDDQTRETDRAIKDIGDELKEKLESLSLRGRLVLFTYHRFRISIVRVKNISNIKK